MGNVTSQMKSENRGKTRGANIQQVGNLGSSGGNAKHRQRQQQHQQQQFINDEHQGGVGGDTTSLGEGMVDVVGLTSPSCEESNVEGESNLAFHNACNFSDDPKSSPGLESSVTSSVFSGRFKKETDWSNQWKIFHALNVNDDKMMLDLSAFLSKLQQGYLSKSNNGLMNEDKHVDAFDLVEDEGAAPVRVPALVHGVDANSEDVFCMDEASLALDDEQWSTRQSLHATTLNLQDIELPQQEALCQLMRIGSTCVNFENIHVENLQDYNLEKESFTVATVHEVIHLYTAGGQLNIKSVRRILRKAYKTLKSLPNINTVDMDEETTETTVTVVGDLHGQLRDLLHLLSCNFPSTKNKYVFNGDFVDRGPDGVEILIILFMLMLALPGSVFLNRGNHEDFGLCCVYGFQKECLQKYNHVVFAMFGEMFCHIPICSVVANRLFVVHGGLFHRPGVTLDEITEIVRDKYAIPHSREFSDPYQMVVDTPSDRKNIMACALWSDPDLDLSSPTPEMNPRGAGILFGPDLTEDFLTTNNLAMVVRSHECVEEGYDLPFEGDMEYTCATIFSASNYGGSMNRGAVMKFSYLRRSGYKIAGGSKFGISNEYPVIYYRVHCWLSCDENDDKAFVERANKNSLSSLVLRRKRFLLEAFRQLDKTDSGHVSLEKWAMVMESVIGLDINWLSLIDIIVDKNDKHVCDADDEDKGECIDYTSFLSKFHAQYQMKAMNTQNIQLFDAVYNKRELLDGIFRFFDQDNDGIITRHEFNKGCELINEELPPKDRLTNTDAILDVMDLTSDGYICINEFFEVFRLVDCYNVEDDC